MTNTTDAIIIGAGVHGASLAYHPAVIGPSHPTVIDFPNELYFRPQGGLTLVGLEHGTPLSESPDGDADHAKPGFVERAIERICERIPAYSLRMDSI